MVVVVVDVIFGSCVLVGLDRDDCVLSRRAVIFFWEHNSSCHARLWMGSTQNIVAMPPLPGIAISFDINVNVHGYDSPDLGHRRLICSPGRNTLSEA